MIDLPVTESLAGRLVKDLTLPDGVFDFHSDFFKTSLRLFMETHV